MKNLFIHHYLLILGICLSVTSCKYLQSLPSATTVATTARGSDGLVTQGSCRRSPGGSKLSQWLCGCLANSSTKFDSQIEDDDVVIVPIYTPIPRKPGGSQSARRIDFIEFGASGTLNSGPATNSPATSGTTPLHVVDRNQSLPKWQKLLQNNCTLSASTKSQLVRYLSSNSGGMSYWLNCCGDIMAPRDSSQGLYGFKACIDRFFVNRKQKLEVEAKGLIKNMSVKEAQSWCQNLDVNQCMGSSSSL